MYYIKHKNREITITDENVYTKCGMCGREMPVDLADCVQDNTLDLFGTVWYCDECSYERALQRRGEPWAEQVIAHHGLEVR